MKKTWSERAHAKINLTLSVGSRRADGYHEVATVLHMLELCDTVYFNAFFSDAASRRRSLAIGLTADTDIGVDARDNLAYRAIRLIEEEIVAAGCTRIDIHIEKNIPIAAGLAGGSADAAAVLRGLADGLSLPLTAGDLIHRAQHLGSDVPACILGGTVLGTGRGADVTRLPGSEFWWVLAHPGGRLTAGEVYEAFAATPHPRRKKTAEKSVPACFQRHLGRGDAERLAPWLTNDLESSVCRLHPGVGSLLHAMKGHVDSGHLLAALVSGSGPTVVGLARDRRRAAFAADLLKRQGIPWVWWGESESRIWRG